MRIKSIVAGAAIALIAGVGSVSANEITVDDTAINTAAPFTLLDGTAAEQMSTQEMAATRGAAGFYNFNPGSVGVALDSHGAYRVKLPFDNL